MAGGRGATIRESQAQRKRGFTLIEIMAVVLIIGLFMTVLVPQMSGLGMRALRDQARVMAGQLELARQRAVMTGNPHRLVVDMEQAGYWVESSEVEEEPPPVAGSNSRLLDLSPPKTGKRTYQPLPGRSGEGLWLDEGIEITGLETPEGWVEGGTFDIVFDPDGATDAVSIVIRRVDQDAGVVLDVHPLIDSIRIRDDEV